jgi:uncharacterized SAM-binding protein YcdF (DUF218 family)
MPEIAKLLALFAGLLMIIAFAIWTACLRGPLLKRLDGRLASNEAPARLAAGSLMAALGVSAVAAVLAIGGRMSA